MDVFWNLKAQIDEKPTHIEWALLFDAMGIKLSVYIIIQMVITMVMLILVNVLLFLTKMLFLKKHQFLCWLVSDPGPLRHFRPASLT